MLIFLLGCYCLIGILLTKRAIDHYERSDEEYQLENHRFHLFYSSFPAFCFAIGAVILPPAFLFYTIYQICFSVWVWWVRRKALRIIRRVNRDRRH